MLTAEQLALFDELLEELYPLWAQQPGPAEVIDEVDSGFISSLRGIIQTIAEHIEFSDDEALVCQITPTLRQLSDPIWMQLISEGILKPEHFTANSRPFPDQLVADLQQGVFTIEDIRSLPKDLVERLTASNLRTVIKNNAREQFALGVVENHDGLVKMLKSTKGKKMDHNWRFLEEQLKAPRKKRPYRRFKSIAADRGMVFEDDDYGIDANGLTPDPKGRATGEYYKRIISGHRRGRRKPRNHRHTKKMSLSLAPRNGRMKFFNYNVGVLFDFDRKNLANTEMGHDRKVVLKTFKGKHPKTSRPSPRSRYQHTQDSRQYNYVYLKNVGSNDQRQIQYNGRSKPETRVVTIETLIDANEKATKGSGYASSWNEIRGCVSKRALTGIVIRDDVTNSVTLERRLNALYRKVYTQRFLGMDLPILIMGTARNKRIYTVEAQCADLLEGLRTPKGIFKKAWIRKYAQRILRMRPQIFSDFQSKGVDLRCGNRITAAAVDCLHFAMNTSDRKLQRLLIKAGVNAEYTRPRGKRAPLYRAAKQRRYALIKQMITQAEAFTSQDVVSDTLIELLRQGKRKLACTLLKKYSGAPLTTSMSCLLEFAVKRNNFTLFVLLLENTAVSALSEQQRGSLISHAIKLKRYRYIRKMLYPNPKGPVDKARLDIVYNNAKQETKPRKMFQYIVAHLVYAKEPANKIIRLINGYKHKKPFNSTALFGRDSQRNSIFHMAVLNNDVILVEYFVKHGKVNAQDYNKHKQTALDVALKQKHFDCAKLILQHKASQFSTKQLCRATKALFDAGEIDHTFLTTLHCKSLKARRAIGITLIARSINTATDSATVVALVKALEDARGHYASLYARQGLFKISLHNHSWKGIKTSKTWGNIVKLAQNRIVAIESQKVDAKWIKKETTNFLTLSTNGSNKPTAATQRLSMYFATKLKAYEIAKNLKKVDAKLDRHLQSKYGIASPAA